MDALARGWLLNEMAPPRKYTPEQLIERRRAANRARRYRAIEAEPRLCSVTACRKLVKPTSDHCPRHTRRRFTFGHPLAGPLKAKDSRRMVLRVLAMIRPRTTASNWKHRPRLSAHGRLLGRPPKPFMP